MNRRSFLRTVGAVAASPFLITSLTDAKARIPELPKSEGYIIPIQAPRLWAKALGRHFSSEFEVRAFLDHDRKLRIQGNKEITQFNVFYQCLIFQWDNRTPGQHVLEFVFQDGITTCPGDTLNIDSTVSFE